MRLSCKCGNEIHVAESTVGRVECPVCHRVLQDPERAPAGEATYRHAVAAAPSRQRTPAEPEDDDQVASGEAQVTSRKAAWSVGLGFSSFLCTLFTGIPAVVLGAIALSDISRSGGRLVGFGLALAGIIAGSIGSLVTLFIVLPVILLVPAVHKVREAAGRAQSTNNLKQIALAMHNYHDAYGAFPTAGGGPGQHANLSWRVTLLPFVEEELLHKQFDLTEPWDSPHNKTLLEAMPRVFAMPGVNDPPGMTRYRVFVGPHAAFDMPAPGDRAPRGRRVAQFTDGTANTILVVEAADAVRWTKPEELEFAEGRPLPHLSTVYGGCNAAMADGSIRLLPPDIPEAKLRAMITIDGGEIVKWP